MSWASDTGWDADRVQGFVNDLETTRVAGGLRDAALPDPSKDVRSRNPRNHNTLRLRTERTTSVSVEIAPAEAAQ